MRSLVPVLVLLVLPDLAVAQEEAQLVLAVASAGETEGAERLGPMREGSLRHGQSRRFSARIPAGKCLRFVARGGAGVQNLDVAIHRGRTALTGDSRTDARADARHCAGERAESVQLIVRAYRGSGRFAAAAYLVDPGAATTEVAGTSPLARLRALAEAHGGDYVAVTPPRREELLAGTEIERGVPLSPGRCYKVFAAGGAGLQDIGLAVLAPTNAVVQEDGTDHATPTLGVLRPLCPVAPGRYRVRLSAAQGAGALVWRVLGAPAQTAGASTTTTAQAHPVGGSGTGYLAQQMRRRHSRVGQGAMGVTDLATGQLRRSGTADVSANVRAGRCYRAVAVGMPSVQRLSLEVRDGFGQTRESANADGAPHVRFCPAITAAWTVRVKMELGYGGWGVQVFEE